MDKMLETDNQAGIQKNQKVDHKAEIAKMFAHMDIVSDRINRNLLETEHLQAETREMLAQMQAGTN